MSFFYFFIDIITINIIIIIIIIINSIINISIRHIVKDNNKIRNNKLADAIAENNDRLLWDEVRKMSKTNNELPRVMDDHSSVEEIKYIFANKYDILYNTVNYDTESN